MSPDGSTKPLPEEKLLKLIRDKKPRATTPPPANASGASIAGASMNEAVVGMSPLRWPTLLAGAFGAVLAIELVYLALQLTRPVPTVKVPSLPVSLPSGPSAPLPPPAAMPSLAASASQTLFASSMGTPSDGTGTSRTHAAPSATAKLLAARLTLMGIVAGQPPQAIIEDSQTKKTYFVTTGQAVSEGAVLEQVLDNRVILDLQGEKIELTL